MTIATKIRKAPVIPLVVAFFMGMTLLFPTTTVQAQTGKHVGSIANKIGKASIIRGGKEIPAKKGMKIYATDILKTQARTAVKLEFVDGGTIMAFQGTKMSIDKYQVKGKGKNSSLKSKFKIATGKIRFFVKPRADKSKVKATFRTANAVMGIRGTSGYIDVSQRGKTQLIVMTGKVAVANVKTPRTSVMVSKNKMTDIVGTRRPTPARSAPANLVQSLEKQSQSAGAGPSEGGSDSSEDSQPADSEKKESEEQDNGGDSDKTSEENSQDEEQESTSSSEESSSEGSESTDSDSEATAANPEEEPPQDSSAAGEEPTQQESAQGSEEGTPAGEDNSSTADSPNNTVEPATADGGGDSTAPTATTEAQPSPAEAPPAPKKLEKKVIFSPDGSSSVHVEDQSIQNLGKNLPTTEVGGASQTVDPTANDTSEPEAVAPAVIAQPPVVSEQTELVKQQIEQIQEANNEIIEEVQETQEEERTIEEAIQRQKIKIKVTLPTPP